MPVASTTLSRASSAERAVADSVPQLACCYPPRKCSRTLLAVVRTALIASFSRSGVVSGTLTNCAIRRRRSRRSGHGPDFRVSLCRQPCLVLRGISGGIAVESRWFLAYVDAGNSLYASSSSQSTAWHAFMGPPAFRTRPSVIPGLICRRDFPNPVTRRDPGSTSPQCRRTRPP